MPIAVRNRYEKLKESPSCPANIDMLIENFDKAVSHPNQNDLDKLIQELKKYHPNVEDNIFASSKNVNLNMILGYKKDEKEFSFLDEYEEK